MTRVTEKDKLVAQRQIGGNVKLVTPFPSAWDP